MPSYFTLSGCTITASGTCAITGASQTANTFLAAPNGSAGAMTPRAIVAADIPVLNQSTTGTAAGLSGASALPNGTTTTTQTAGDNSAKLATTAYVGTAVSNGAYTLPAATTSTLGGVKTDGNTITNSTGAISCTTATASQIGCVKPDGTTITIVAGVISAVGSSNSVSVRQTVSSGPTDTNGMPTLFPSTYASLSLTSYNVTSTYDFVATAAQGFSSGGSTDYVYQSTNNITWSSLTASTTNYLYINASTGVTGSTTLAPIYVFGGTPAVTSGQFTFVISQMTGYLGNGTTAVATPVVFVGEAVTAASTVTSTVAYAYNGMYSSPLQAMPSTATVLNHNLGVNQSLVTSTWKLVNVTAQNGYSPGAEVSVYGIQGGISSTAYAISNTTRNVSTMAVMTGTLYMIPQGGGADVAITAADWNVRLYAQRNF
jgi:hypothetical protein